MNKFVTLFSSSLFLAISINGYAHGGGDHRGGGYHGGGGREGHGGENREWHNEGNRNWNNNWRQDGDWHRRNDWHETNNYYWYGGAGLGWGAGFYNPIYYSSPPAYVAEQPAPTASYSDYYDNQSYSQVNQSKIPTFTLKVETPTINVGEKAIIRITSGRGKDPVTIYWRTDGDADWMEGGPNYEQTATKAGTLTISTVVKDGNGIFSEPQISQIQVNAGSSSDQKKYSRN